MTDACPHSAWRTLTVTGALVTALAGLTRPAALAAQHEGHAAPQPATAAARVGTVTFASSGAPAARPSFLQGVALLHNFQYAEAAAAFREAQQRDPDFAMAYWGEAMTYNHGIWREQDSVAARAALARLGATPAERLAKAPTAREQDYLRTLDVLYAGPGAKPARDTAYAAATEQLAKRYPNDPDAQLFHALALLSLVPRTDTTYERAAAIAERVLRDHPQHPGALHYLIHAYDDPAHARRGLAAAQAYAKVAPDASHAQHMTSHIFIALGMWDDVVAANEVAVPDARKFGAGAPPACGHYGQWLQYAYMQQGRLEDARRMTEACRAGSVDSPDLAFGFAQMRLSYIVGLDDQTRDAASTRDVVALTTDRPGPATFESRIVQSVLDIGTAYHALRRGDTATAQPLLQRIRETHTAIGASPMARRMPEIVGANQVLNDELGALTLLRRGKSEEAVALLRQAAAREDALPFSFGPPAVDKPSHELLGEVLLELRRPAEARREFELALARTPGRSLTLLGLARASRAAGDSAAAAAAYRQLLTNWRRADPAFRTVGEARGAVAGGRLAP